MPCLKARPDDPRPFAKLSSLATWIVCAMAAQACTGVIGAGHGQPSGSGGGAATTGTGGGGTGAGSASGAGNAPGSADGGAGSTDAGAGGTDGGAGSTGTPPPLGTPTIARLSELQWANSVRDLLLLPGSGSPTLATADAVVRLDNEADSLFVGQDLHDDLQAAAENLAAQVAGSTTAIAKLVPANAPTDATGKATAFIQSFGRNAFRRPLTTAEVQSYLTLFNQGSTLTTGYTAFAAGVRVTLEAFLQSPYFLYRTGFGGTAVQGRARLTDYEIAANLSYALTNTIPDATLSTAANQGALETSAAISAQATRLMATAAGKAAVDRFYFQFFGLGQYDTLEKDPTVAPQFTAAVGPMLDSETAQFLQYIFGQNGTLRDIFRSPVTFVNSTVAALYGLPGTFSTTWKQVQLDPTRPGILTRLGFLAYYGHDGTTQDSIHRGVYINRRLLCKDMSPPPGVVLPTIPPVTGTNETNRQIVTSITGAGTCGASCHGVFINPAGFAFENFNGLGTYETTENGQPVDSSDSYPFTEGVKSYTNEVDFSQVLSESEQLHSCYATGWAADIYARIPRADDVTAAGAVAQSSLNQNISSAALILALTTSDAFVTRVEAP
jgi:Protein of unknown function (DUF1592)/Protein of unknown function (DUF1588)/Protein of unknown function (DUF1595)/Protein of unknown function (DUF1587)